MPIIESENENFNEKSVFQEIGAYTVEDYKRDTERKIARLEAKVRENERKATILKAKVRENERKVEELKRNNEAIKSICEIAYKKLGSLEETARFLGLSTDYVKSILNLK